MARGHNGVHSSSLPKQSISQHGCVWLQLQLLQDLNTKPTRSVPMLYIIEHITSERCCVMLCVWQ